ncbi:MAG TPA: hypothetical protein VFD71_02835 [Planctomycetota bacterium]|nr:hypothetical protein [Planctomycetota bacterium]
MANENQGKPSRIGGTFKLFLVIFLVLCVPVVMDQVDVDPDKVKLVGRYAAGATALLILYGIFKRILKIMAFVIVVLLGLVLLVSEGQVHAPRVKDWFAAHATRSSK